MRRFAARLGVAVGVLALFAVWMIGGAAWIAARPADPMLWPPRYDRIIDVYVISNGYHAGLALPRAHLAEFAGGRGYPALIAVTQRFAAFDWIEFGWGEREFYQSVSTVDDINWRMALRALFYPGNRSVVHVVGISGEPTQVFKAEMLKVSLSWNGFDQMLQKLDATFVPPQNGALPDLRSWTVWPKAVLAGDRHVQDHARLQSLDRRPAGRSRAADKSRNRDRAGRVDRLPALARGACPGAP